MSGQGNPPQGPPSRTLVSLRAAEPFVDTTGRLTGWARQFLQRLISLVGPPVAGDSQTIIEQLTSQSTDLSAFEALVATEIAALEAEIAALELQIIALQAEIAPGGDPGFLPPLLPPLASTDIIPVLPLLPATDHPCTCPIYFPLVTGVLPGPDPIADALGQFIMVPT